MCSTDSKLRHLPNITSTRNAIHLMDTIRVHRLMVLCKLPILRPTNDNAMASMSGLLTAFDLSKILFIVEE